MVGYSCFLNVYSHSSSDLRKNLETLEKNGVNSLKTMVNLGSEVYMQAEVYVTVIIYSFDYFRLILVKSLSVKCHALSHVQLNACSQEHKLFCLTLDASYVLLSRKC